jgi:hypothetical protein
MVTWHIGLKPKTHSINVVMRYTHWIVLVNPKPDLGVRRSILFLLNLLWIPFKQRWKTSFLFIWGKNFYNVNGFIYSWELSWDNAFQVPTSKFVILCFNNLLLFHFYNGYQIYQVINLSSLMKIILVSV